MFYIYVNVHMLYMYYVCVCKRQKKNIYIVSSSRLAGVVGKGESVSVWLGHW